MEATQLVDVLTDLVQSAYPTRAEHGRRREIVDSFRRAVAMSTPSADDDPQAGVTRVLPTSSRLRVSLLGRFTVAGAQGEVTERAWATQKAMLLAAFLATRAGRPVTDASLIDAFWPSSDEERGRASLRNALHVLRGTLAALNGGTDLVERNRRTRTVTFTASCEIDADVFERRVDEAQRLFDDGCTVMARDLLLQALPLYAGELLEGFLDDWILALRAHYAEVHLRALHLLARCHLGVGEPEAAERVARRAVAADELREDLRADLMEALVEQGRRGEALRQYREAAAYFEEELGEVPSALRQVGQDLLGEQPQQPRLRLPRRVRCARAAARARVA